MAVHEDIKKIRMSINRSMSLDAICVLMAEGDRTVYKLLVMCAQIDPNIILTLDTLGMRGAQIFEAFIGFCDGWFIKFKQCVLDRNLDMIAYVNQHCPQWVASRDRFKSPSK